MAPDVSDAMEKRRYAQMTLSTLGGKSDLVHQLGLLCFLEASTPGDKPAHPALHALISERRADLAGCTASQSLPSQAPLPSSSIVILSAETLSGSWATTPQAILALLPPLQPTTPPAERMQTLRPSQHSKAAPDLPQRACRVSQPVPSAPSAPITVAAAAARVCAGAAGQHPPSRGGPSPPSRQTQHHQQPQQQHVAQQQQQAPQQHHQPQAQQHHPQQHQQRTQQQRSTQGFATAGEVKTQQDSRKRPLPRNFEERQSQAPGWGDAGSGGTSRGGMPSYARQREVADGGFSMSSAMGPPVWSSGTGGGHGSRDDYDDVRGGTQFPQSANGAHQRVMKKFVVPTRANGGHGGEDGDMGNGRGNGMRRGRDPVPGGAPGSARAMVNRAFAGPVNGGGSGAQAGSGGSPDDGDDTELPEELKGCDKALVERITNDIIDRGDPVTFDDIAGLEFAKKTVYELVCWPMKRPDIFTGLRAIPKGLLLFGPPGTGKTLIGKAIASQSGATFFNISASSLTSKWIGEGERMVRTLFMVATYYEPAIIFIDEVDSLLCQRSSDENEATRRLKTEFLVQLDGAGTTSERRVLVIGATNRPQELDEAARRRFIKRLYIPLPEPQARRALIKSLLNKNTHRLMDAEIDDIVRRTAGWSGADLKSLCTEAAMGPIRDLAQDISSIAVNEVPDIMARHFEDALRSTRPSVSEKDLAVLYSWNDEFGTYPRTATTDRV